MEGKGLNQKDKKPGPNESLTLLSKAWWYRDRCPGLLPLIR